MKHPIITLFFIVLLSVSSCATIEFDREYEVNKGEEFVINLKTNPSTGYHWAIEEGLSDSIITLQGDEYVPEENPTNKPRLGAGGTKKWHFRAEREGQTILKFIYKRPGTKDTNERKLIQIRVK
ncbi:MAG: protease inhibitor I42 family protein [Bacteroidales bacterium]|nr:protease inhibitor I42 family protein [Bacteroidales bacterium]